MNWAAENHGRYQFGPFILDLDRGALQRDGVDLALRPKSFEVLHYLVAHPGKLISNDELVLAIWGHEFVSDGSLTQCVIDIRRLLADSKQTIVRNVPRRGYMLDLDVERLPDITSSRAHADGGSSPSSNTSKPHPASRMSWLAASLALLAMLVGLLSWWTNQQPVLPSDVMIAPGNSIAVLPFTDMSQDASLDYLGDGLAEEILNSLAQLAELNVIARSSSFQFRDASVDINAVGARLNVAWVLEGSIRTDGDKVRITAQLINAATSTHTWSQTYDRKLDDVLALQAEIAEAVVQALHLKLSSTISELTGSPPSPQAYEAFQKAEFFYNRRAPGDIDRAAENYRLTTQLAPDFARAWVGLSGTLNLYQSTGMKTFEDVIEEQLMAALKGVELGPNLAAAHMRLAQAYWTMQERQKSDEHYELALKLGTNDPHVLGVAAGDMANQLNFDEAVQLQSRAAALDPLSALQHGNLAILLLAVGRAEEALTTFAEAGDLNPQRRAEHLGGELRAHYLLGYYEEVLLESGALENLFERSLLTALALQGLGRHDESAKTLQPLHDSDEWFAQSLLVEWHSQQGQYEEALQALDRAQSAAIRQGVGRASWNRLRQLPYSPMLIEFRTHPGFQAWYQDLLQRHGIN